MSTIAPNDPNIVYSPYTWDVTAGAAKTINAGAYLRIAFTGTPGTLAATFDITNMVAPASQVGIRIDGGNWLNVEVAASVPLTIPTDNTWGSHTVEIVVIATTQAHPRWVAPQGPAIIFTGLTADTTVTTRLQRERSIYAMAVGDSITEGVRTLNMDAVLDTDRNDSRLSYAYPLGDLLGAEIGVVGFGGTGISKAGAGGVPKFRDSVPYLWDGKARSLATPRAPDFILAHIGTNDPESLDADVVADTTSLLNGWIAATAATPIIVLPGWLQRKATQIQQGIAACDAPSRVHYVDTTGWWATADAADGLHPYGYINTTDLSQRVAATIKPIIGAASPPVVFRRAADGTAVPISAVPF